jgi:hypothetical protein
VFFGFLFHSESGNNCHLDHVYITSDITGTYVDFTADSLIAYVNDTITFTDASLNGPFTSWEWNFGVGADPASASGQGPHKVIYTQRGAKSVSLQVDDTLSRVKINYIEVDTFPYPIPYGLYAFVSDADVNLYWNRNNEVLFDDSFESGDFTQWDDVIEGPGTIGENNYPYWFVQSDTSYVFTGEYSALVSWGYDIDTWIISPVIPAIDPSYLSFIWQSSYYWNVDPNDHGDLWVKISTDGGSTWDSVWTFGNTGAWDNWTWYETTIDLSDYAGQDIQIAFNLVANDNGDVALEDVNFSGLVNEKSFGTRAVSHPLSLDGNAKSIYSIDAGIPGLLPLFKTATLVNYSIFRDYIEVATSETNSYSDLSLPQGIYTYYVVGNYLNPFGTSSPSNSIVVEVGYVSIDDKETGVTLLIYPNPSNGIFNIETVRDYTVTVLDVSGNSIDEFNVGASCRSIDLSAHGAGLYILKFKSDESTFAIKVIVN